MRTHTIILTAAITALLSTAPAFALIQVPTEDFPSIQSGIDAAEDGDTMLVAPGEYVENINFDGKNIIVSSYFAISGNPDHIAGTVIDGGGDGTVVTFENGEQAAVLVGFTVQNGSSRVYEGVNGDWEVGGGIYCENSGPSILNCTISENSQTGISCVDGAEPIIRNCNISGNLGEGGNGAGGICCFDGSNPIIMDCIISENQSTGIYSRRSSPEINGCTIIRNEFSGINCLYEPSPIIFNCNIIENSVHDNATGLHISDSNLIIENCVISGHTYDNDFGGGIKCIESIVILRRCSIVDNNAEKGGAIACWGGTELTMENCTISRNNSESGGAIYIRGNDNVIINNSILWNTTDMEVTFQEEGNLVISFS